MKINSFKSFLLAVLAFPLVACVCNSPTTNEDDNPQISETTRPIPRLFEKNMWYWFRALILRLVSQLY